MSRNFLDRFMVWIVMVWFADVSVVRIFLVRSLIFVKKYIDPHFLSFSVNRLSNPKIMSRGLPPLFQIPKNFGGTPTTSIYGLFVLHDFSLWLISKSHLYQALFLETKPFPRSSVKYFTDALFGMMPECNDIVEMIQLMNFLLFEGQTNKGFS